MQRHRFADRASTTSLRVGFGVLSKSALAAGVVVALTAPGENGESLRHKLEGIGCPDIAAELACTPQAVRSLLVRAYAAMRLTLMEA